MEQLQGQEMKVLLICLARRGGMVHYHVFLANALAKVMPTAVLCAQVTESRLFDPVLNYFSLDTGAHSAGTFFSLFFSGWRQQLRRVLEEWKPDLVHIVAAHEWNPLLIMMIKRLGYAVAYTIHDPIMRSDTRFYFRALETLSRRMADAWFALSQQAARQLLQQGYPAERVFASHLGSFRFAEADEKESAQEENIFLFFGRIEPYKGLEYLLKAAPEVLERLPNWRVVIAGSGDLRAYRAWLTHPQIEVVNHFLSEEEVGHWMRRAKIVVLPYIEASQSAVIATAFGFGKAVISSDVGSIAETLKPGENGLLVAPKDTAALAQAMLTLAGDESLRTQLARNNRLAGQQRFDWEPIAREHWLAYQKILARSRALD